MKKEKIKTDKDLPVEKLISFFFEIGTLRKITRAHQQALLEEDASDNISAHSFRTAMIGYFLAKVVGVDENKVIKMCLFHDIEEARTGDQNWIHRKYVKTFEEEVRLEQLSYLPSSEEILKICHEYDERKTLEAKVAKDADMLDEVLLLKEYELAGNTEAKRWLADKKIDNARESQFFTQEAKVFFREIKKQSPHDWWKEIWMAKRRR